MTFIDKNTLLITEKNGGLIKTDVKSGKSVNIQHKIPLLKKEMVKVGFLTFMLILMDLFILHIVIFLME